MANISFEEVSKQIETRGNGDQTYVNYFALKGDGAEAIVRIMHDNTNDFDLVETHPIQAAGWQYPRHVSCLRSSRDSFDKCPLCSANVPRQTRMYVHMIQYTRAENGSIIATPVVWDKPYTFAMEISNLIKEYGPLSDCIFKIKRTGEGLKTSYSLMYGSPQVYPDSIYEKHTEFFQNYHAVGTACMEKSFDDLQYFLSYRDFPKSTFDSTASVTNTSTEASVTTAPPVNESQPISNAQPAYSNTLPTSKPVMQRPIRYFN